MNIIDPMVGVPAYEATPALMSLTEVAPAKIDGRTLRSERTHERIVGATLALIREGDPQPRTADIAERAGVSVRSIFQHFADTEALFVAVADKVVQEVINLTRPIPEGASLRERIDALVEQHAGASETLLPIIRSIAANQGHSPALAERSRAGRLFARHRTEIALRPELDSLPAPLRLGTLDSLSAATDWDVWANLRTHHGLDIGAATAVLRRLVRSVIEASLAEAGKAIDAR